MQPSKKKILVGWQRGIPQVQVPWPKNVEIIEIENSLEKVSSHSLAKKLQYLIIRASFSGYPQTLWKELSNLKGIGLISTGTDNMPVGFIRSLGIEFIWAQGINSAAVVDYTIQALLQFWERYPYHREKGVGIVGFGNIGSRLGKALKKSKTSFSFFDPFVKGSASLDQTFARPIISFHVPLTKPENLSSQNKKWATQNMLNEKWFLKQAGQNPPFIIQTSRGGIWEQKYYYKLKAQGKIICQDVYPLEPPSENMLANVEICTPHIAGYSTRGRFGGLEKVLAHFFPEIKLYIQEKKSLVPKGKPWLLDECSQSFKKNFYNFLELRNQFPYRKEFSQYTDLELLSFYNHYKNIPIAFLKNIVSWDK